MKSFLNFSKFYHKFHFDDYTTIRRKESFNLYQIGDILEIQVNHVFDHKARLVHKELKSINEMSLDFLINDCRYEDFTINNKEDFLKLLNTFYTGKQTIHDLNEPLAVFYLKKI